MSEEYIIAAAISIVFTLIGILYRIHSNDIKKNTTKIDQVEKETDDRLDQIEKDVVEVKTKLNK